MIGWGIRGVAGWLFCNHEEENFATTRNQNSGDFAGGGIMGPNKGGYWEIISGVEKSVGGNGSGGNTGGRHW